MRRVTLAHQDFTSLLLGKLHAMLAQQGTTQNLRHKLCACRACQGNFKTSVARAIVHRVRRASTPNAPMKHRVKLVQLAVTPLFKVPCAVHVHRARICLPTTTHALIVHRDTHKRCQVGSNAMAAVQGGISL